jgi:hypothetical protein
MMRGSEFHSNAMECSGFHNHAVEMKIVSTVEGLNVGV